MNKYIRTTLIALVTIFISGCDDWLDISPKTQIKSDDNYASEQGYKDALTGVYLLMANESLYGKELTFGMTDAMAQYYTGMRSNNTYTYDAAFDYDNTECESRINSIWSNMYTALANLNELIKHIDQSDASMFTGRNRNLIRGEAYALRAFMHFDLARLWGSSYVADKNDKCIPYMKHVTADITPLSTVEEVINLALADLEVAQTELRCDPVIATNQGMPDMDEGYEHDRTFKMNYYATKLLEARMQLYAGRYSEALSAAKEVINQNTFYWTPETEITTSDGSNRNRIFSEELVFCLYDSNLRSRYSTYFTTVENGLLMNEAGYQAVYELYNPGFSGDYRYAYQNEELDGNYFNTKLMQPTSGNTQFMFRIPLMRLSEAYYIAAECELELNQDIPTCIGYLNTVRSHRNLTDGIQTTISKTEARDEILKEYRKEFMCEGQLYYYYKRLNFTAIPIVTAVGNTVTTNYVEPNYIFPLPDDEIEYGGRNDE
ncbi:MAG: RagB/SusD family nutrient uptake outer membrane protein [Paraprevotella sp.]|nr:RagB/SusD family nutrient uptake outer membrane protein [Paraprevotella sp.]MBQ8282085.1 RagB/SusD family nutrient uptake outer membrane protein [Paraprevotella sp.]